MKNPNVSRMKAFALWALVGIGLSVRAGDLVVPGVWNGSFAESLAYANENHKPLLLFVGAKDCGSCQTVDAALAEDARFLDWMRTHGEFVYCSIKGNSKNNIAGYLSNPKKYQSLVSEDLAAALNFTTGSIIPRVAFYWPGHDPEKQTFSCWKGYMPINEPKDDTIGQLLACLNAFFADYTAVTSFVVGQTPSDRLEALPTATSVLVPIRRSSGISRTNPTFLVVPRTAATNRIDWASGQTEAFVTVELPSDLRVDDVIDLILLGEEGAVQAESSCRVVTEPECAPKNPLWFGERDAATLRPGEWTMDVDLAQTCARAAGSFTLNLVGGSLWCPDCVNVDANLVETDAFRAWVAERELYCTAIDVPAFPKNGKTCLLTYEPTSVSDRYVNATVPPQERLQSGAGYLSRKGIPLTGNGGTNATDILARNLNLVTNAVSNGGLCRPECLDAANTATFSWKTGVPCLIVQDAAGRILGRLDQFSNVSPTDAHAAAAYVRRLDEILALADDPTEELNRDWSTATTDDCALDIRGGARASTVSAIDLSDHWRLTGRDRWTRTTLAVKGRTGGTDETDVRLNLWRVTGGKATKVAMREGNLASGVTLPAQEIAADPEVEYFVQVEAIATSAAFALDRDGDSVAAYDLTAESADDAGTVSFGESARTVSEAEAKKAGGALRVRVPVVRTGGASGATNATVAVDAASTAFPDRYRLVADTVAWADGEQGTMNFEIDVFDDDNADGTQVLRLTLGGAAFALTIEDNDRLNVGKLAFADAEPALAKKGLVIAEEGTCLRVAVARTDGASGDVACTIATTAGAFGTPPTLAWPSRSSGAQWAELDLPTRADCPSGKVTLSFAALEGGVKADASARTLTVQLVGADAPRFETDSLSLSLTRYCAVSQEVAVLSLADGAKAKVAKLSGSVPSGVSAKLAGDRLVVSGAPTAKGDAYEAVYQVSQTIGHKTEPGLTIRLSFAVTDVAALDPSAPGANPSVRARRTVPDLMVVDAAGQRLVGILSNLTIQPTGRCTANYRCSAGTVSLSSRGWAGYDAATGALTARLTVAKKPYALAVTAQPDGTVKAALADPDFADGLAVVAPATAWSRENPATAWVGAYTAAFRPAEDGGKALANGAPVVTLELTASAARTGKMRFAGFLPNGQSFSGSAVLTADGVDSALLPICYRTSKDFLTAVLRIQANGATKAVTCDAAVLPWWTHAEALPAACSEVCYGDVVGSRIDARQDLLETVDPAANGHDLVASGALEAIPVTISEKTAKLDPSAAKAVGATLSLNRKTGLLSGRFRMLDAAGKTVTANYRGVLLPDWGDGCPSCGDIPWAMGAYWFGERLTGELDGRPKTLTVNVGDTLYIEAN
ncbi:MAG: thioredoxin family protein [Kiritimatiellia bacterium]